MGAWADGLAAQSRKEKEIQNRRKQQEQNFLKKFFDYDLKDLTQGVENKAEVANTQQMYFLLLRQILINQESMLMDTETKYKAGISTRSMIRRLENFMLGTDE